MTDYTIKAKNVKQWADGIAALLHNAETIDELEKIRAIHMTTANAVKKTNPDAYRRVAQIVQQRRSMLAQKP